MIAGNFEKKEFTKKKGSSPVKGYLTALVRFFQQFQIGGFIRRGGSLA